MHDQLLATYSFFSALTENGKNIYNSVYIPICKRCISLFAKSKTSGTDSDIQSIMKSEYGIEVPLLVLRRLIKAVAKDLSRRDKQKFNFQVKESRNSFSFTLKSFSFNDIEETYASQRRKTNALQEAFELFVKNENGDVTRLPIFADFIDKNKKKTSAFLVGDHNALLETDDSSFMPHARFLQYIEKNNDVLYKCVQQIFIGSLIATYLESNIDFEAKIEKGIIYYLDTQLVLELLDLQRPEDTKPAYELIRLIKDTGGVIRIMNITCREIKKAIDIAIETYSRTSPNSSINEACIRNHRNKTWLIELSGHLKETLSKQFGINFDDIPEDEQESFKNTNDAEELKKIWLNKRGAEHDVMAYLFVRKKGNMTKIKRFYRKLHIGLLQKIHVFSSLT